MLNSIRETSLLNTPILLANRHPEALYLSENYEILHREIPAKSLQSDQDARGNNPQAVLSLHRRPFPED